MSRKKYIQIKTELKEHVVNIRKYRLFYKLSQSENRYSDALKNLRLLTKEKYEFRHKHIAISQARGRSYDQIEQPYNEPNFDYIRSIFESIEMVGEETDAAALCVV